MMHPVVENIAHRLQALGLTVVVGQGTDVSVNSEFVSAGWSTGSKRISYEAAILLDQAAHTVLMFEKTTESGSGFSFGGDSDTSFQSGKTLYRKVKIVQYGPEGKAYEVELDLGAIPKAVKQAAQEGGFGFKTVLRKSKAMYAPGQGPAAPPSAPPAMTSAPPTTTPPTAPPAMTPPPAAAPGWTPPPTAPPPGAPPGWTPPPMASPPPAEKRGLDVGALVISAVLALLAILMLAVMKSSIVGWVVALVLVAGVFFLMTRIRRGPAGLVIKAVIAVVAALALALIAGVTGPPTAASTTGTPSATAAAQSATPSPTVTSTPTPAQPEGWQFTSANLTSPVDLSVTDAGGFDANAVVVGNVDPDYDKQQLAQIRLAYSNDAGSTWAWAAPLSSTKEQAAEGVMMTEKGAVLVGWQRTVTDGKSGASEALIALAAAPDFALRELKTPAEFAGQGVLLYDAKNVGGTWVIAGICAPTGCLWQSSDEGETWTRSELKVDGQPMFPTRIRATADGTLHLIGITEVKDKGYHAAWISSGDKGKTFTFVQPEAIGGQEDDFAEQLVFNDAGVAALLVGTHEGNPDGQSMSALYVSNAQGAMQRLGAANLPDQPGSPLTLGGVLFFNDELIAYGSPKGFTRTDTVQFWKMSNDGNWQPGAKIVQGEMAWVDKIIMGGDNALAFGLTRDAGQPDTFAIWKGSMANP